MISFVIPAHNEEELIGATVRALRTCGAGELEIIVADDSSTDQTGAVAVREGARVVRIERRHIAAARNAGAKAARGEMLVFVDADTIVPGAAVREAVRAIENGAVAGGASIRFDGWVPLYARVMVGAIARAFRLLKLTGGCFLFCRKDVFDAAGGWDERYYVGEEVHLCRALKRFGKFTMIRERVTTSGRKLRTYSAGEVLGTLLRLALQGMNGGKTRKGTELWYGERRIDAEKQPRGAWSTGMDRTRALEKRAADDVTS